MNTFIHFRDGIRRFVLQREMLFVRLWNMVIALVGLFSIRANFGYQKALSSPLVCLILSVICVLFPIKGVAFLMAIVLLIDLFALSFQAMLVAAALIVVFVLLCAYFHSKNTYNIALVPVCYGFGAPYVMSLGSGLMSNLNELCSVVCGTVMSYYLHIVKTNAAAILDETSDVSIFALLKEQMLTAHMFYFYVVAMVAMYIIVYMLRTTSIRMSWLIANIAGVLVEFTIMLSGCLLTNQKGAISALIVGNVITLAVGFFLNYFVLDLDYSRIEKVQFEDDDYYYYVTAVPKIRIVEEEKEVKKF